ncbi:MAG: branched-chain amino acid ABC transporter permease [Clostridiales bacterium]|nr:branched-chain amino acid ABC transporter permease [Clostridiales bacterium]
MINKKAVLKATIPYTIPVLTGYLCLGIAYGILMDRMGFPLFWTLLASLFIYAGSMQFVTISLLAAGFDPIGTFLMTLMVNARHIFYGISMLKKYQGIGILKPYLILALTDETFSIVCSEEPPEGINRTWFYFFITLLNHLYWVTGSLLGGILGSIITINTKGLDFALTALFVVIFVNQWKSTTNHLPALIGVLSAITCRLIFGSNDFIIPSMVTILILVTVLKKPIIRGKKKN